MTLYEGAKSSLIGIAICLCGLPVYAVGIAWKNKPAAYFRASRRFYIFLQKLFVCVPEEKASLD